ncbi:hypothetical protein LIER_16131 [Lithospermum erythrorhizon]|uniref:Uncharacterized protein n=1 Tax=Lithospermum erythrorhizon TaxID=34254 RepID=A0AAV3Q7C6_LITER
MNMLLRKSPVRRLSLRVDGYEPLDQSKETSGDEYNDSQYSRLQNTYQMYHHLDQQSETIHDVGYRLDRARKRHVFLQTYKLSYMATPKRVRTTRGLKRMVIRIRSVVISVISVMWAKIVKSGRSLSALRTSSPARLMRCC